MGDRNDNFDDRKVIKKTNLLNDYAPLAWSDSEAADEVIFATTSAKVLVSCLRSSISCTSHSSCYRINLSVVAKVEKRQGQKCLDTTTMLLWL